MKRIVFILLSGLVLLLHWGCGETVSLDFVPSNDRLLVNDIVMNGNESQTRLSVQANCSWTVSENVDWLVIQPMQGNGNVDITLTTGVNPSSVSERKCQFTVTTPDGVVRTVQLNQGKSSESLSVAPAAVSFGEVGGTNSFTVTSNTEWTVRGGAEWLSYSPTQGSGDGSVSIAVQTNSTEFVREAELTVTGKSGTVQTVKISQSEKSVTLTIEPEIINATAISNDYIFNIHGNASWRITVDDNTWVSFNKTEGSDEDEITVSLKDNSLGNQRVANIRVTTVSGRIERTCVVTQAPATLPTVQKVVVSAIGRYKATVDSEFASLLGVSDYGFVWSTSANPTLENCLGKTVSSDEGLIFTQTKTGGKAEVMTGGTIGTDISSLTSGVTYHVRAFARNAFGVGYSDDEIFVTGGKMPGDDDNNVPTL